MVHTGELLLSLSDHDLSAHLALDKMPEQRKAVLEEIARLRSNSKSWSRLEYGEGEAEGYGGGAPDRNHGEEGRADRPPHREEGRADRPPHLEEWTVDQVCGWVQHECGYGT